MKDQMFDIDLAISILSSVIRFLNKI